MSQRVHLSLCVVAMRGKHPRQLVAPRPPIRLGEERSRVEQLVQQDRMARQIISGPRGRAYQLRETRQKRRMLDKQCEVGAPPTDFGQERAFGTVLGQLLRLPIVAILQAMLDVAQKAVRVPQSIARAPRQYTAFGEGGERVLCSTRTKLGLFPAPYDL